MCIFSGCYDFNSQKSSYGEKNYKQVTEGSWSRRIFYLLEHAPIVSQIIVLFQLFTLSSLDNPIIVTIEKQIVEKKKERIPNRPSVSETQEIINKEIDERLKNPQNPPLKVQVNDSKTPLKNLKSIKTEIENYAKDPTKKWEVNLVELEEEKINAPIKIDTIEKPQNIYFSAKNITAYRYCADTIDDKQWGCGWRAIQTCLSSYNKNDVTFKQLFHMFGPLEHLQWLYKNKTGHDLPEKNIEGNKFFSPYESLYGRANAFIGQMVMHFYGISSELKYTNGDSEHEVDMLELRIADHFIKNETPIMMDNGVQALNIIGMGYSIDIDEKKNTVLWISDPSNPSELKVVEFKTFIEKNKWAVLFPQRND